MKNNNIIDIKKSLDSLYLKKDYKTLIDSLLKHRDDFDPGLFHFNLGTVYAKKNEFAYARYNLEMAQKLGQIDSKSLNNLNYVKHNLNVQDISNSRVILDQAFSVGASIPSQLYYSMSLILVVLLVILWTKNLLKSRVTTLVYSCLSLIPAAIAFFYISQFNYAVNLKTIDLFEGPSKVYEVKRKIDAGSKFLLGEIRGGWYFIDKPLSLSGWIEKKNLGILK